MKLLEIAQLTNSQLEGDPELEISALAASPQSAQQGELALVFPNRFAKAIKLLKNLQASAYLISVELSQDKEFISFKESIEGNKPAFVISVRPKFALSQVIKHFHRPRFSLKPGVDRMAFVDETARIDSGASVGSMAFVGPASHVGSGTKIFPRVYIGTGVIIGQDCEIRPGAVIEDYCVLGDRVIIQPNAVIGGDGYSYITEEPTNLEKMQKRDFNFSMDRQIQHKIISAGHVILEDDVEIGANTCVDRGTIGPTLVGRGTKIDNLCQIAHNVQIGKDCLIIAQTGIAGSAKIGDRVTMAGSSGCGDGVEIGNDVVVGAFSAVNSDVDPFMPVLGAPAIAYGEFMRRQRAIAKLPKQQEEFRKLKSRVEELGK